MSWRILGMLGSVMTLLFAITLGFAGAELLLGGDLFVGVGLFGVALAMVVVDRYVATPSDLPVLVASKVVDTVVRPPDEE
jgi:hypothetical protein